MPMREIANEERERNVTSETLLTDLRTRIISAGIEIATLLISLLREFSWALILDQFLPRATPTWVSSPRCVCRLPLNSPQSSTDESRVTSERDRSYFLPRPRYPMTVRSGRPLTVANDGSGNEQRLADSCLSLRALRSEHDEAKLSSGETGSSGELYDCSSVAGFHVRSSSRGSSGVGPAADSELRCDAVRCDAVRCVGWVRNAQAYRSRCDSVIRRVAGYGAAFGVVTV